MNKVALGVLAFGHVTVDMQTSSLAVMLPILLIAFKLDYAAAALLVTFNSITSSLIQPLFGVISDRVSLRFLLPLGCILAAAGMSLVLVVPSYALVLTVVIGSGLGSAAFHPEGSRNANFVSGDKKATGVSVFFVGGNLGFALGPLYTTAAIALFGPSGSLALGIPGLIGGLILWRFLPVYGRYAAQERVRRTAQSRNTLKTAEKKRVASTLSLLLSIISVRAAVQTGLTSFIPLYFVSTGSTKEYAALLLTVSTLSGAVGTLAGGPLSDKLGGRTVLVGSIAFVTPLLLLFLNSSGPVQVVALALASGTLIAASSLTVVMTQQTLPNNIGLASGLSLGLGFGAGGLGAAALGTVADRFGLGQTMLVLAFLPLLLLCLSIFLPTRAARKADRPIPVEPEAMNVELSGNTQGY